MLEDVNGGIAWTLAHAAEHGGDPQRTYLVGQSCGAQLAALSLVTQARARPAPAGVARAHPRALQAAPPPPPPPPPGRGPPPRAPPPPRGDPHRAVGACAAASA